MSQAPAIQARGLSKRYLRGREEPLTLGTVMAGAFPSLLKGVTGKRRRPAGFWALENVSFEVGEGERVGIIGPNGAGKTTLLKILSRIVYPTEGEARIRGRVTSLLEVGTGFNLSLSGRENIYLNASMHGLSRRDVASRFDAIVEFSGVREFLDMPVRHYSSGMFMRLAFSVAAHLDPDVLLLDEVLAVGDLSFQQKCLKRVEGLTSEGRTVLFVSHSMDAVARFCDRCLWLDRGRVVMDAKALDVVEAYVAATLETRASREWTQARAPQATLKTGPAAKQAPAAAGSPPGQGARQAARAPEEEKAPGNDRVRLVSARVVDRSGQPCANVAIDAPVGIEVVFEILKGGDVIQPALHFKTARDTFAFVAAYTDPLHLQEAFREGRYLTTAWIPPNLLNAGIMHVTVGMATPDPLVRHCTVERAVSFNVYERMDRIAGTARGLYAREFPGDVRPLLQWETRKLQGESPPRGGP